MEKYTFYPPTFSPLQTFPHALSYDAVYSNNDSSISPPQWNYFKNGGNEYFNNDFNSAMMSPNWALNGRRLNSCCCTFSSNKSIINVDRRRNRLIEKDQRKKLNPIMRNGNKITKDGILKGILNNGSQNPKRQIKKLKVIEDECAVVIWGFEGQGIISQLEKVFSEWRLPKSGKLRCKSGWAFVQFPSKPLAHEGVEFIEKRFRPRDGTKLSAIILRAKAEPKKRKKPVRKSFRFQPQDERSWERNEIELIILSSDSEGELFICEGSESGDHGLLCGIFGGTPPSEPCAAPKNPGPWHSPTCPNFTTILPKKTFSLDDFSDLISISYANRNSFSFEEITDEEEEKKETKSNLPIKKRKTGIEKSNCEGSLQNDSSPTLLSVTSDSQSLSSNTSQDEKHNQVKVFHKLTKFRKPLVRPFNGIRALDSAPIEDFLYNSRLELMIEEGEDGRNIRILPQKCRRRKKGLKALFGKRPKQKSQFQMRIRQGPYFY